MLPLIVFLQQVVSKLFTFFKSKSSCYFHKIVKTIFVFSLSNKNYEVKGVFDAYIRITKKKLFEKA